MQCNVLESAAAELVDESLHPLEQLELLTAKVDELKAKGETDAVIECRIKQLSLQKVLSHIHRFPLQPVIQAQAALAEAYGQGGYFAQAKQHITQAREVCNGGIYGDLQCRRLQADLLASEGTICFAEGQLEAAEKALMDGTRLGRETRGGLDRFTAQVHILLGQAYEDIDGRTAEPTLRVRLQMAEAQRTADDDRSQKAVEELQDVVRILVEILEGKEGVPQLPRLLAESSLRLALWLQADERDQEAFQALEIAENTCKKNCSEEDLMAIDIKRHMASLHIKLGRKKGGSGVFKRCGVLRATAPWLTVCPSCPHSEGIGYRLCSRWKSSGS